MKKIRLGDVATYINGYAFKPSDWSNDGVPIIRIQDLTGNSYQSNRYSGKYESKYEIMAGDVLISWSASLGVYVWQGEKAVVNQHIFKVVFDKKEVDKNFFVHQTKSIMERATAEVHGATMKHLTKPIFDALPFYLPTVTEQKRIATELDKITDLIDKRKKQLEKLDELVKSRFIEMFGDCDLTAQKKEWKAVREVGTVVGGSTPKTSVAGYWNGEYRWLSPAELEQDSGVIFDSVKKITKAGIESCSLQELPVGTVILSSRAPIGKLAIAGNTFYCNQGFKNIVCSERIVPQYLYSLLLFNTEYLNSLGRGATFKEISKSIVENIKIPIPPIDLQNEFAKFVAKTDKSKFEIKQSLEKLELLKKALMQKYFG